MRRLKTLAMIVLALSAWLLMPVLPIFATTEGCTPSDIPFSLLEDRVDAIAAAHVGRTTPGAAVVVVHEGEIIFSKGYGFADLEKGIPVDPAVTRFDFASVSKQFIWVSAMQLVEQGRLDLDVSIATYLPDDFYRQLNLKYAVTMRNLMNHAAGFEPTVFDVSRDLQSIEKPMDLVEALLMVKPRQVFEPGTASSYSNFGAALAAFVVGNIAGREYAEYEREYVISPSGMTSTLAQSYWLGNGNYLQHKAQRYFPDDQGGFIKGSWSYTTIYPAGTVNGTAQDLAMFAIALTPPQGESGSLFSRADSLNMLFTPSSPDPFSNPGTYHGFWRYDGACTAFGHAGHGDHFSNFVIVPDDRFGFAVLSNGSEDIVLDISDLLLGHSSIQDATGSGNLPTAGSVEGSYIMKQMCLESTFLVLITNLTSPVFTVKALDENTIEVGSDMYGVAKYRQTEPYRYQIISDNPGMAMYFHTLAFQMEDDHPVMIHVGYGKDLTFLSQNSTFGISLIGIMASMLFFLISPLILLIIFLIRIKKGTTTTRFQRRNNLLLLSGTLLTVNNLFLFGRLITMDNISSAPLAPHIWFNHLFAILSILLFSVSLVGLFKEKEKVGRIVFYGISTSFMAVLVLVLHSWNFFVFL